MSHPQARRADRHARRASWLGFLVGMLALLISVISVTGPAAATVVKTPPSPPTALSGSPGDGTEYMTWAVPTSDGGKPISGYTVTAKGDAIPKKEACSAVPPVTSCTLSDLTNGVSYRASVVAINVKGTSLPSTKVVIEAGLPAAPTDVIASPADASASVSWNPAVDNGSTILSYTATAVGTPNSCTYTVSSPETDSCSVGGLTNGTSYTFVVTADNTFGASIASAPSVAVTPSTSPAAPANVVVSNVASGSATVSWTAPSSGLPITGYTVAGVPGCMPGTSTSCTANGLSPFMPYTACVSATSAAGPGDQGCSQTFRTLPTNEGNTLAAGADLGVGEGLVSPSNLYFAVLQYDGNFVVYPVHDGADYGSNTLAEWSTQTGGQSSTSMNMQTDGNFVLYASGTAVWNSDTQLSSHDYVSMQDDGNLVVYSSSEWLCGQPMADELAIREISSPPAIK